MGRLRIRQYEDADADDLWAILHEVFAAGETYAYPPDTDRETGLASWTAEPAHVWVAEVDGRIVGTSRVMSNQPGLGSHVANGSYIVAPDAEGRGVGRALAEHSLRAAKALGYRAMQFNLVVSTNERAIALWHSLGFETVGRLQGAFELDGRDVDALVMYRRL